MIRRVWGSAAVIGVYLSALLVLYALDAAVTAVVAAAQLNR